VPPAKDAIETPSAASEENFDPLAYCKACSLYPIPSSLKDSALTEIICIMITMYTMMQENLMKRGLWPLSKLWTLLLDGEVLEGEAVVFI
jgi:hypothetical protein